MSGIVGTINLDGAPVDRDLLRRMTDFMSFRGPDAQEIWTDGNVGFGHTMLRTTWEAETEKQPLTLDGKVWLTTDARIDGRSELIAELEAKLQRRVRMGGSGNGSGPERLPNDAELILLAYEAWGEDCVKHLIGDFAFAIWDAHQRRLFCARDHFGVKPFYYLSLPRQFFFSNTLNCLRQHPEVSNSLNDQVVGDFLLFEMNYDLSTTIFADIHRLPPAHFLVWQEGHIRIDRYWDIPEGERVRYREDDDYVSHFRELLDAAVGDRLRIARIGVFMSGGLDSTSIAATAKKLLDETNSPFDLRAHTTVYEKLISDREREYARLVAEHIDIPINYFIADNYELFEGCERDQLRRPEPMPNAFAALGEGQFRAVAKYSRVVLYGHGPDAVLSIFFPEYIRSLSRRGRKFDAIAAMAQYAWHHRRLPPVGARTFVERTFGRAPRPHRTSIPTWINPQFAAQWKLQQRFADSQNRSPKLLSHPYWIYVFERDDADSSAIPIEPRYPFFDIRLISYLLSIPAVKWRIDKNLLRFAMRGFLPERVRLRPKTPLTGNVVEAMVRRGDLRQAPIIPSWPGLETYVIKCCTENDDTDAWSDIRLICFSNWMAKLLGVEK